MCSAWTCPRVAVSPPTATFLVGCLAHSKTLNRMVFTCTVYVRWGMLKVWEGIIFAFKCLDWALPKVLLSKVGVKKNPQFSRFRDHHAQKEVEPDTNSLGYIYLALDPRSPPMATGIFPGSFLISLFLKSLCKWKCLWACISMLFRFKKNCILYPAQPFYL